MYEMVNQIISKAHEVYNENFSDGSPLLTVLKQTYPYIHSFSPLCLYSCCSLAHMVYTYFCLNPINFPRLN